MKCDEVSVMTEYRAAFTDAQDKKTEYHLLARSIRDTTTPLQNIKDHLSTKEGFRLIDDQKTKGYSVIFESRGKPRIHIGVETYAHRNRRKTYLVVYSERVEVTESMVDELFESCGLKEIGDKDIITLAQAYIARSGGILAKA